MYPVEFVPPDLVKLQAQGSARRIMHGPMTISGVLERGRLAMEAEDQAEAYRNDPVAWLRAHRPRRTLGQRLLHGKGH